MDKDERKMCISIGQRFLIRHDRVPLQKALEKNHFCNYEEFILALVNSHTNEINLIDVHWGGPWAGPIRVKNPHAITDKEFISLVGKHEFIRII